MGTEERDSKSRLLQRSSVAWTPALIAAGIAVLSSVLVWLVWPRSSEFEVLGTHRAALATQLLSTAAAAATSTHASTSVVAVATQPPKQPSGNASPSAAGESPGSSEHTHVEQQIIDAFSCARAERGLPAYERNDRLSYEANTILARLQREPEKPFGDKEPGYTLTGQLLIDFGEPSTTPCSLGVFDVASVDGLDRSSQIGVAVAPLTIYDRTVYLTIIVGR